jgi:hypothetical protein
MGEPTIEITGPEAEEAEHELQALLRETFGEEGRRLAAPEAETSGRKIDATTLALIAIGLSIPKAILETIDLAEKMKLVERIKRLLAWAKGRGKSGTRIALVSAKGTSVELATAEPADVIAALSEATSDVKGTTKK